MRAKYVIFNSNKRKESKQPGLRPGSSPGWEGVDERSDLGSTLQSVGESEQGMLFAGDRPAEVRISSPLPLKFQSFFQNGGGGSRPQTQVG